MPVSTCAHMPTIKTFLFLGKQPNQEYYGKSNSFLRCGLWLRTISGRPPVETHLQWARLTASFYLGVVRFIPAAGRVNLGCWLSLGTVQSKQPT